MICKNCKTDAIPLGEDGLCYGCEIERLHKQDAKGDAPKYFALSEAGI